VCLNKIVRGEVFDGWRTVVSGWKEWSPEQEIDGWKVFFSLREYKYLLFEYHYNNGSPLVHTDEWLRECNSDEIIFNPTTSIGYRAGFHIFLKKEDAEFWATPIDGAPQTHQVVKVKGRKIVAIGAQSLNGKDLEIAVAEELFVPSPPAKD
jgi:hypothetical protein